MLFVDEPSSKLFCILCQRVFKDPVITSCGVRLVLSANTDAQSSLRGLIELIIRLPSESNGSLIINSVQAELCYSLSHTCT